MNNKKIDKKAITESQWNGYKEREAKANERMMRSSTYGKGERLKNNVTYYNVKAMEAFERGDYDMAADYTELVRRNLERLATHVKIL